MKRPVSPAQPRRKPGDVDVSLIDANLRRVPWERLKQHGRALHTAQLLRRAMEKHRGRT